MAHSGSFKRSQDILSCGLCEIETKIKMKCMDCDLYMCEKCTDKVHAKFKNSDLHDIVALKDIHSHPDEVDATSEFRPVKCKDHRKQLSCMYCLTCELLVCPVCIAKTHQLHLLEEIQTVCQKKVEEMKILQDQAKAKIEKLSDNLNLMKELQKSRSDEVEQNILKEEKQAREVHLLCVQLLEKHREMKKRQSELMSRKGLEILTDEKAINTYIQQIDNSYKSRNTEKFLETVRNMNVKFDSIETTTGPKLFNMIIPQYVPNYEIRTNSKSVNMKIQFEAMAKYEINMLKVLKINSITSDKDGNIWVTDGNYQIQQLQLNKGIEIMKSLECDLGCTEIRCWNKNILFTSTKSKKIRLLTTDGKFNIFQDLSPNMPFSLHVSDIDITVGMNCASVKDSTDSPIIMRLGFDGKVIQIFKNYRRQLLTRDLVRCCTTTNDGAVCYIDGIVQSSCLGDVVSISGDGTIQWKYCGNSYINSRDHPFTPVEVLSTNTKLILVSDKKQHAIHVLTVQGELLTIFNLTLIGFGELGVMTVDVKGTLWIGDKERLSSLKITGF